MNRPLFVAILGVAAVAVAGVTELRTIARVGQVRNGATLVASGAWVSPQGITATLPAAIVDGLLLPDGKSSIVKTSIGVSVVDLNQGSVIQDQPMSGGSSMTGLCLSPNGKTLAASGAGSTIFLYAVYGRRLTFLRRLNLPNASVGRDAYPCGMGFLGDDSVIVAASRDNSVEVVNVVDGKVQKRIPCDAAPYSIAVVGENRVVVGCWGRAPQAGGDSAPSSGTPVAVDSRGITPGGSLDLLNIDSAKLERRLDCPSQPTEMCASSGTLYVAFSNGDQIGAYDAQTLDDRGDFPRTKAKASGPDSICVDSTHNRLYVAYGGLDQVAAYDLTSRKVLGVQQTGWYPTLVRSTPEALVVGTAKGFGSRRSRSSKHGVYDLTSTLSIVANPVWVGTLTRQPVDPVLNGESVPVPVPIRLGAPSVFKHVVYVIKENRTYDQLLGDLGEGDSDPRYVMYGKDVTPNHHALAAEFADLDNYYCNGILSADGHAWATESNATSFYEHSHGGWTRSYPFGDDPLATTYTGYIWDNALSHGVSVQNFGEFDYASPDPDMTWTQVYRKFLNGDALRFKQNIGVARLRKVSIRDFPGWNLGIPDVVRASRFVKRLHEEEAKGSMPALTLLYLPDDHTSGGSPGFPSPSAQLADNDLALGRCIDAISHSKFWPSTVVFVNEDDPQDGYDHVDGYRSLCLVISPFTKRRSIVSDFYNQAGVLHTIERILGLPPMNHNDAAAPLMTDCFQSTPDLAPYNVKPNRIPLDEKLQSKGSVSFDLKEPDDVDPVAFNKRLWALAKERGPVLR